MLPDFKKNIFYFLHSDIPVGTKSEIQQDIFQSGTLL